MSLEEEQELEERYLMHTFARKPVELVGGRGMVVQDSAGKRYLDFIAGIGVVSLGHCHPALVEALESQSERLVHVGNYYYIEGRGECARRLSNLINDQAPEEAEPWRSFFANSGAEANECAIKLARRHAGARFAARREAADGKGAPAQGAPASCAPRLIVTLENSFHGRTLAALAATAQEAKQEAFLPLPDGFVHTPLNDLDALQALFDERGAEICAVMVECVQGESGVHPCTRAFLHKARQLSEAYGALLICDEVQTGVFRCARPFAFQHFGVTPDVVTVAKGVASGFPMGICAARAQVASAFQAGDHGSTFGGSCLAVAAANATLRTLVDEGFAARVDRAGAYLRARLAQVPEVVEVRGLGLMAAADVAQGIDAGDIVERALGAGLLLNATGPRTLRFLPPLVCSEADIDAMIEGLSALLASA